MASCGWFDLGGCRGRLRDSESRFPAGQPSGIRRHALTPRAAPRAGLVFLPGGKVDPRAYVPLLRQVSAAGYLVVVVKEPYGIGFLAIGEPARVVAATPGVTRWGGRRTQPRWGGPPGSRCRRATPA
ncbi:MAG TPA: alpha/beta hydrolase [Propionibacteriaceae bacterium]|nr:alpha/beta hydrolase [Propionibacteriaceae bacterium]